MLILYTAWLVSWPQPNREHWPLKPNLHTAISFCWLCQWLAAHYTRSPNFVARIVKPLSDFDATGRRNVSNVEISLVAEAHGVSRDSSTGHSGEDMHAPEKLRGRIWNNYRQGHLSLCYFWNYARAFAASCRSRPRCICASGVSYTVAME